MAQPRGTETEAVGAEKAGKTLKRLESNMNTATEPTKATYLPFLSCAFSTSTSRMPKPTGLVISNSAICCAPPGLSTDNCGRSHSVSTTATANTTSDMTKCSGIGMAGFDG